MTIVTSSEYLIGAAILHQCLIDVGSKYPLKIYAPDEILDNISNEKTRKLKIEDCIVPYKHTFRIPECLLKSNKRTENAQWNNTFDKLLLFGIDSYEKVVFVDSDMMVRENLDQLFDRPHMTAVSPSVGSPDYTRGLNSGLMVIEPQIGLDKQIITLLNDKEIRELSSISDNDLIVKYYENWGENQCQVLNDTYNILFPYVKHYLENGVSLNDTKIVHFIGNRKPWMWSEQEWSIQLTRYSENSFERSWLIEYQRLIKAF